MAAHILATVSAGALFGGALTASGVAPPSVIVSQMQLRDFHMAEVFLAASASSALVLYVAKASHLSECKPRSPQSLGWLHRLDGNVIGGAVLGAGMAVTGTCPGTIFVQLALGVRSALAVLVGGLLGGVYYSRYGGSLRRRLNASSPESSDELTIYGKLHVKESTAVLAYEILCLAVVLLAMYLQPSVAGALVHPIVGGILIGVAQATSMLLTGNMLGTSSSFEQVGRIFWRVLDAVTSGKKVNRGLFGGGENIIFVSGVVLGSLVLSNVLAIPKPASDLDISPLRAVLGGFMMIVGARLGGGCTSGHGITGLGMLSYSSLVSVVSMFAGGIGMAYLMR